MRMDFVTAVAPVVTFSRTSQTTYGHVHCVTPLFFSTSILLSFKCFCSDVNVWFRAVVSCPSIMVKIVPPSLSLVAE